MVDDNEFNIMDMEDNYDYDDDEDTEQPERSEVGRLRSENERLMAALVKIDKITRQLDKNNITKDDAIEQVNDEIDGALNPPNATHQTAGG